MMRSRIRTHLPPRFAWMPSGSRSGKATGQAFMLVLIFFSLFSTVLAQADDFGVHESSQRLYVAKGKPLGTEDRIVIDVPSKTKLKDIDGVAYHRSLDRWQRDIDRSLDRWQRDIACVGIIDIDCFSARACSMNSCALPIDSYAETHVYGFNTFLIKISVGSIWRLLSTSTVYL